ncbi:MAG TPA: hypothetical protein VGE97_03215 [Nitrososphaera sp.]|jgi:hypothetical protein
MKGFVWDYIIDRLDRIGNGENLERILTSDVWYDLVDETKDSKWNGALAKYFRSKYNLDIKGPEAAKRRTRETIISYIKDVCDELGIRRADVRILAGDVGYLYYRGNRYAISLDDLDSLKLIGTDLLIIEKQGIAEALKDLAADYGIALLSTRGFLTENAIDLARLAESSGANVAILTDNDISGYVIAHKVPSVPRIGIDFDTLEDLGVSELAEGEYYTPDQGHLKYAEENMPDLEELDLLRTRRIEINAVKNKVGSKKLWNWIARKLEEKYPNRNGNRAVNIPEAIKFILPELYQLISITRNRISRVLEPEIERVEEELSEYKGLIESVSDYESQIKEEFEDLLNGDVDTSRYGNGNGNGNGKATKDFLKNLKKDVSKLVKKYYDGVAA